MADAVEPPASSLPSRKRRLEEEPIAITPVKDTTISPASSTLSTPMTLPEPTFDHLQPSVECARQISPAPSTLTSVSVDPKPFFDANLPATAQPPPKRRKLTPQEKLEREQEKLRKAEEKLQKKQIKEQEEQQKAEEKRRKAEEREDRKRVKELEDQRKAQERENKKKEKEDAIQKKERSQLRLNSFFTGVKNAPAPLNPSKKPSAPESPSKAACSTTGEECQDLDVVSEQDVPLITGSSTLPVTSKDAYDEYRKTFLPFNISTHTSLAPSILPSSEQEQSARIRLDACILETSSTTCSIANLFSAHRCRRGRFYVPVKTLIERLESNSSTTIDLTTYSEDPYNETVKAIKETPIKYLYFEEDVRPPYCGTWTKPLLPHQWLALRRNPTKKLVESLNYDYDSEAEWEEPEDGEELGSEGEEDLEDEDEDDDMDGFVDDEAEGGPARRLNTIELQVRSTGLCWEHASGALKHCDGSEVEDLSAYQMEFLLEPSIRSIDPFSSNYWETTPKKIAPPLPSGQTRLPLGNTANLINRQQPPNQPSLAVLSNRRVGKESTIPKPPKRFVNDSDLNTFKQAVRGRTETKQQLVPILHSLFQKKYSKDIIAATLSHVASRNTLHKQWFLLEMPAQNAQTSEPSADASPSGPID